MGLFDRSPAKTPVVVEPPPPPPPPPSAASLTAEQIRELVGGAVQGVATQLNQTVATLTEQVSALANRQPQVVVQSATVPNRGVTDEEIDQAVLSGQGSAAKIRQLIDRQVNEAADRIVSQHVKPLQDYGVATMGELSRRMAMGNMPHYVRFKKEIDAQLGALNPEVRSSPQVIEMVYNSVVGSHAGDLVKEAEESAVRRAQEEREKPAATPGTGAGPGGSRPAPELRNAEQLGGEAGLEALALKGDGKGQNQDDFARGMGYRDWADYMKQYEDLQKAQA